MSRGSWPEPPRWPPETPPWTPTPDAPPPPPCPAPPGPPIPMVPFPDLPRHEDVFDKLLERRIVLISGRLDQAVGTRAAAQLMLLDASGDDPIDIDLSCPDGDLDAAIALADTIDLVGVPVRIRCRGRVGGPAVAPLTTADHRSAHPHTVFVLKDPRLHVEGRARDLTALVAAHRQQLEGLHLRLAQLTGHPRDRIEADMQTGKALTAAEARDYGLIQDVTAAAGDSR